MNKKISEQFPHDYIDDRIRKAVKIIGNKEVNRYLDIGCSNGLVTKYIAEKVNAKEAYGVDVANVKEARKRGVNAFEIDLNEDKETPFASGYFDLITCLDTLEHVYNTDFVVDEIYRLLKKGGVAVITVPRTDSLVNIVLLALGFQMMSGSTSLEKNYGAFSENRISGHMAHFTKKALIEMFKYHNFKIEAYTEASAVEAWFGDLGVKGTKITPVKKMLGIVISKIPFKKEICVLKVRK